MLAHPALAAQFGRLAPSTRGTVWGWVAGHALGWGGQDSTVDPKGNLKTVPRVDDASRFLVASVGMREQLSNSDDAIGTLPRHTGESP